MTVAAKRSKGSKPVGVGNWQIFPRSLAVELQQWIDGILDESPPALFLPYQYGPDGDGVFGPAVSDPLAIYVQLPFGRYDEEPPTWVCSLSSLVEEAEEWVSDTNRRIAMAQELRRLADILDAGTSEQRENGKQNAPSTPQDS